MATVKVGSLPGSVDLTGVRGDKWGPFEFTATTTADLSGRTWLAQVRVSRDHPSVICDMVVDSTDAASGVIRVSILPAESADLVTGPSATDAEGNPFAVGKAVYYWDLQATLVSDATDVKTWFSGKVNVIGDVAGAF